MPDPLTMIRPESAVLLVVDVQDKLLPAIHDTPRCVEMIRRLIEVARALDIPLLATEQYPAGLGRTCSEITAAWGDLKPIEKTRFSACIEATIQQLAELDHPHVIVCGIEAHVCVQQTVLDLLRLGYAAYVPADAISSRRVLDRDTAIERVRQAGAIVTTSESLIFELLGEAATDTFRRILPLLK